ncbi:pentapeptide repeat-containing protein [Arsenophonus endosymbiont of Aleurodicus floccissimus]|uniref:pentapeptide repeat-containing protein n=1 Tax=Arsenophonus endosymbiont of Aleurodicus floccissimus TaxID=2152761 RepID=UPI0016000D02
MLNNATLDSIDSQCASFCKAYLNQAYIFNSKFNNANFAHASLKEVNGKTQYFSKSNIY